MPRLKNDDWRMRAMSAEDVVAKVPNGSRVFIHGAAATPTPLTDALAARPNVQDVTLYHLHLEGGDELFTPQQEGRLFSKCLFVGPSSRRAVAEGRADFVPVFLSEIPELFRSRRIDLDVAMVQLSPPDRHGLCTLGTSVDCAEAAVNTAATVIAEINERMPRTHGQSGVPISQVDAFTITNRPLPETPPQPEDDIVARIGDLVAELVPDGACLQAGIGAIPNAALSRLKNRVELGVHTEMFSDGIVDLYEAGAISNSRKPTHQGQLVTSFVAGSRRVYDFVDDAVDVEFLACDRTNDVGRLSRIPDLVAINSALQIDLTGQVCADSIGSKIHSGIGGQMDFVQGAGRAPGGVPIIALPATAKGGSLSRIQPTLVDGSGVVTTRGHVRYVVTEFGRADLHGLSLRERADALVQLAHPDFRGELAAAAAQRRGFVVKT